MIADDVVQDYRRVSYGTGMPLYVTARNVFINEQTREVRREANIETIVVVFVRNFYPFTDAAGLLNIFDRVNSLLRS